MPLSFKHILIAKGEFLVDGEMVKKIKGSPKKWLIAYSRGNALCRSNGDHGIVVPTILTIGRRTFISRFAVF